MDEERLNMSAKDLPSTMREVWRSSGLRGGELGKCRIRCMTYPMLRA